jgi:hypothetical protein
MLVRFSRLFLLCVLASLTACGGSSSQPPRAPGAPSGDVAVYVAGSVYSKSAYNTQAVVWTNGVPQILPTTKWAVANAVASINGNTYVVGQQYSDQQLPTPVVWINGVATVLNNGNISGSATAIYYDGVHVWIAGYLYALNSKNQVNGAPVYWEDQGFLNQIYCPDPMCTATGIAAANGHIYISGNGYPNPQSNETEAIAWKDGAEQILSGPPSAANGVVVIQDTPYYAGTQGSNSGTNQAVYWTPLQENFLQNGTQANGAATDGSSLYIAGNSATSAYAWTNLAPTQLPGTGAVANAISVSAGQTYTAGTVMQKGVATAGVWTGNTFAPLTLPHGQKAAILNGIATLNLYSH